MIAIPWYFAQQGQLKQFGLVYLLTTLASLFWSPFSGALVDKYDRRKIFLFISIVGAVFLGFVSILGFSLGQLSTMVVGSAFMFTFLNYNIHYPNLYAFVQEITTQGNYSKISSYLEVIGQFTTILSGGCASLLLEGSPDGTFSFFGLTVDFGVEFESWPIHKIFMIDGMTYFLAFVIIYLIRYKPLKERKPETGSVLQRLKVGLNYLLDNKPVLWFGVLSYAIFLTVLLDAFYVGVSYVNNHLEASGDVYANSKMIYAFGAFFVGGTLKLLFTRFSLPAIVLMLSILTTIVYFVLFATKSLPIFFVMLFLIGVTNGGARIARITYLFRNVPNQFFGRAGSIFFLFNIVFRIALLGILSLSFFQEENNIIYAYLIMSGIVAMAAILLIIRYKTFDLSLKE